MKYYDFLEDWFLALAILAMGAILTAQIFCRYALNYPLVWSEELARFIFAWVAFIGASYGVKNRTHISMSLFFDKMPRRLKLVVQVFNNLLAITVFILVVNAGWHLVVDQAAVESAAMRVPMSWLFAALPAGCLLMSLRLILDTVRLLLTKGDRL